MNKSRPADAVTYLTKAITLDPADADLLYYRGLAYMQEKKNAEAKADLNKYLRAETGRPRGEGSSGDPASAQVGSGRSAIP